jgi:2-polyprenyl-3-methyl-5-hydroxy-6-metoxy-1,4-benzoquinol methylase
MTYANEATLSIDKCQICGGSKSYKLVTKEKFFRGAAWQSSWVECINCDSAHIDPYPSEEELFKYYSTGYVEMDFEGTSDENSNHKLHYSSEYEKIVFQNYGYSLSDAGISKDNLQNLSVLDYGCATGQFFKYLTDVCSVDSNSIYGVDVESDMLEACRKLSPNFYAIDQAHSIGRRFDLITMWNVIEHIYNPRVAIQSVINLLEKNGEILVETPMYGLLAKKLGDRWSHYIVTEHINLFSRGALIELFAGLGMECISQSSFGANLFGDIDPIVKSSLDQIAKEKDFGATQVLRFKKFSKNNS